jgi:hypothetical protein
MCKGLIVINSIICPHILSWRVFPCTYWQKRFHEESGSKRLFSCWKHPDTLFFFSIRKIHVCLEKKPIIHQSNARSGKSVRAGGNPNIVTL